MARDGVEGQYRSRDDNQPIWKCPCIKLFITYFRHLEKRHPYWPETNSRPILARAIWASIWKWSCSNPITGCFPGVWTWTVYFRSYWSYKNAFIWTKYVINTLKRNENNIMCNIYCSYKQLHENNIMCNIYCSYKQLHVDIHV